MNTEDEEDESPVEHGYIVDKLSAAKLHIASNIGLPTSKMKLGLWVSINFPMWSIL